MNIRINLIIVLLAAFALSILAQEEQETESAMEDSKEETENPQVLFDTSHGSIIMELYPDKAPKTVKHFLKLVDEGHYEGIIFHRAVKGFVIQAGSWEQEMVSRDIKETVEYEGENELKNVKGSVAMARGDHRDSAAADFFINTVNNGRLNHRRDRDGYTVFGKVIRGMDVVEAIEDLPTHTETHHGYEMEHIPDETVMIISASRVKTE